jgi:hypothetical protein
MEPNVLGSVIHLKLISISKYNEKANIFSCLLVTGVDIEIGLNIYSQNYY